MRKTKKCRHGTFTYYTQDYYIGGALEVTGENSPGELDRLKLLVPPDGHVVMAGANIGTIAVPLAKHLAAGSLAAFEPQPTTHALLVDNFEQNGIDPRVAQPIALGDRNGTARMTWIDYNAEIYNSGSARMIESGTIISQHTLRDRTIEVDMITLDSLNPVWLDLLHADVEGSELEVIQGATQTILRCRPFLYVENNQRDKSAALIRTIADLGYACHWHMPALYNPAGGPLVSANMLCVPGGKTASAEMLDNTLPVLSEHDNCDEAYRRFLNRKTLDIPPTVSI